MLSVIMPVYNCARFLPESIESILNQTYPHFELVIINDGSTDESEKIIHDYALRDMRIKFINRTKNRKIVYTLNEGINACTGKYIARMDADDIAYPNRFEKQIEYLEKHPHIFLLGTSYTVFRDKKIVKEVKRDYPSIYLAYKFLSDSFFCHPSVMFRREAIDYLKGYRNTEAEDFDLFSRLIQRFKCRNLKESLLYYREHDANRSFEFSTGINESTYETYRRNYTHYLSDLDFCLRFYNLHKKMSGSISDLPKFIYYSQVVINKVRKGYNVSVLNKDFLKSCIMFYQDLIKVFVKKIFGKLKNLRIC
jgi:glycosyltransferase involved in cell wall biosynthesis